MLNKDYLTLRLVRLRAPAEWSSDRSQLSFVFPKGGQGSFVSGPIVRRLAPGDVLVTNANTASPGKIGVPESGELIFWCFSVSVENLFPLFASNEVCLLQGITDGFKESKHYAASSPLAAECHRLLADLPPQADLGHRSQLLRIVAAVFSLEFTHAHRQRVGFVRVEEHMAQVFEELSSADMLSLSVGELATRFGCSRRHLSRLFHQYFGMSVAALRMEMRLLKAVSLLRDPDAKIINVAEECGFNHLGLFNICFKRRFGHSPGQWRKSAEPAHNRLVGTVKTEGACPLQSAGLCPMTAARSSADIYPYPSATVNPPSRKAGSKRALAVDQNLDQRASQRVAALKPKPPGPAPQNNFRGGA